MGLCGVGYSNFSHLLSVGHNMLVIHAHTGLEVISCLFFILNYADDFCGCESQLPQAQLSFDKLGQLLIYLFIY